MARPPKVIDWKQVDHYLMAHATCLEIAAHFGMHPDTFSKRLEKEYNMGFSEYAQGKKAQGLSLLRAAQMKKALQGNGEMLKWLGINLLKQSNAPIEQDENDAKTQDMKKLMDQLSSAQSERKMDSNSISTDASSA